MREVQSRDGRLNGRESRVIETIRRAQTITEILGQFVETSRSVLRANTDVQL